MASQLFLISYTLDGQPMTCELHSETEILSREEAHRHLEALYRPHDAETVSDIQVNKMERTHELGTTPGHYQQPRRREGLSRCRSGIPSRTRRSA